MTRELYISLLKNNDSWGILYNSYLIEVNKEPKLDIHEFSHTLQLLSMVNNKDINELLQLIKDKYNKEFKVMKVFNKDKQLIGIV